MHETSLSLLNRLRRSPESESWDRLVKLYAPLIRAWLRKYDVQDSDADDLVQEVLLAVSKDLRKFEHGGQPGAFRGWLKAILVNRLRKFWRGRDRRAWLKGILVNRLRNFWRARDRRRESPDIDERLAKLENPTSELSQLWNEEHDQYVLRQLLKMAKPHFAPNTWTAFSRVTLMGDKPREVASDMQISLNAVVTAKYRVLSKLRQEAEGLIDSFSGFSGRTKT